MDGKAQATFESILDALASAVAVKLRADLNGTGGSTVVMPRLLCVDQAAAYLGRSKEAVQHMVASGKIPVVRSDRRVFLDIRDLDAWIEQNKQAGRV
jgi:excisionase family DNA binding protein